MSLKNQQIKFARFVSYLISFAFKRGYEVTLGDAFAVDRHSINSLHYDRLAIDLNLFRKGKYLKETRDHEELGLYWESLDPDCRWGGHFNDGNHYEMCRPKV
jgi:hypothetical protein